MDAFSTPDRRNIIAASVYFFLSTIITWYFIKQSPLYFSTRQQVLSCTIAGAKWAIQIIIGWLLLRNKKWLFIRKTGFTCLLGSLLLLPYCFITFTESAAFFFLSLIVAVLVMVIGYYLNVTQLKIGLKWWLFWLACLAIAITLQLTVVFHIIKL